MLPAATLPVSDSPLFPVHRRDFVPLASLPCAVCSPKCYARATVPWPSYAPRPPRSVRNSCLLPSFAFCFCAPACFRRPASPGLLSSREEKAFYFELVDAPFPDSGRSSSIICLVSACTDLGDRIEGKVEAIHSGYSRTLRGKEAHTG